MTIGALPSLAVDPASICKLTVCPSPPLGGDSHKHIHVAPELELNISNWNYIVNAFFFL